MNMSNPKVFLLKCAWQEYAWGKLGSSSEVARILQSANNDFVLDEQKTYAELWMGTHPNGPSKIVPSGEPLSSWIGCHPESIGKSVCLESSHDLPFLFKVLSVNVALSIQVHPNKDKAVELHRTNPGHYPDGNHKPEMAIALTPFEALCGFRPKHEIVKFLSVVPELHFIIGSTLASKLAESCDEVGSQSALRDCYTTLMTSKDDVVKQQLEKLINRLRQSGELSDVDKLVLRLHSQFPADIGCFCVYFLNIVHLQPGQAIFLDANLPHAYLAGDCLECMACSDNVVRAGLTPKFKDVSTLCSILDYRCRPASENLFGGQPDLQDSFVTLFKPPVQEFAVAKIQIPADVKQHELGPVEGPSIIIVLKGNAVAGSSSLRTEHLQLKHGSVVFVSARESLTLTLDDGELLMFRAFCVIN